MGIQLRIVSSRPLARLAKFLIEKNEKRGALDAYSAVGEAAHIHGHELSDNLIRKTLQLSSSLKCTMFTTLCSAHYVIS